MPSLRFIVVCATICGLVLAYLLFAALRLPANMALAFALFSTAVAGMFAFALRIAVEDKRRHVD